MDTTYFETVMAFVGFASIVIGSFAEQLKGHANHSAAQAETLRDYWSARTSSRSRDQRD